MSAGQPFSLLIKPVSADCNMRCAYCFYLKKSVLYPTSPKHRMPLRVLERIVSSYMATEQQTYSFCWQGGEPTLIGLGFFQEVDRLQKKYGRRGSVVANALQTNGTLIHDKLARHLADYNYLIGVSLDGPEALHDSLRLTAAGQGTHKQVLEGIQMLKTHRVQFNIVTAVHSGHRARGCEVYRYMVDSGFFHHQYIPIVEFDPVGRPLPCTIRPEDWGDFLCQIFDQWMYSDPLRVSIRYFDAILARLLNERAPICTMSDKCCHYFLVEHNGDIYPCDFFAEPKLRLGNIMDQEWTDIQASPILQEFGSLKSQYGSVCKSCSFLELCVGDCPRNRCRASQESERLSWLCAGWKMFYEHSLPGFRQLARRVQRQRSQQLLDCM